MSFNLQDLTSQEKIAPSAEESILLRRLLWWTAQGVNPDSSQQAGVRGAAYQAYNQVTLTTPSVAQDLVSPRATRRSVLIRNLDDTHTVWVGGNSPQVTSSTGTPIFPGEGIVVETTGVVMGVATSGAPVCSTYEIYD